MDDRLDNAVLLKIHRQFSHDESIQALLAEIRRQRTEIGILQSEKAELEDRLKQPAGTKKVWTKDAFFAELVEQRNHYQKLAHDRGRELKKLIEQNLQLHLKLESKLK